MSSPNADPAKVKRYTRLAIIFAFLLAFLWPLGGYFFWIFGGAVAYFLFLIWYYSPRQQNAEPQQRWTRPSAASYQTTAAPMGTDLQKKVKVIFVAVLGFMGFIFTLLVVIGLFSADTDELAKTTETNDLFNSTNIDDLTNAGNTFFDQQQYDSALKYYEKVLSIEPENQYGLYNKALVLFMREDYRSSAKILRRCLQLHPNYGYAYYLLGDDYKAMSRPDTALICFEKAYEYEVRDSELLLNLGAGHQQIGNGSKAVQYYLEALERDSSLVEAYKQLAVLDRPRSAWYQEQARRRQNP